MKKHALLTFLLILSGLINSGFGQSNQSKDLERFLDRIKISYEYSKNLEMYKIEYCKSSNCATVFIDPRMIDNTLILKFYTFIGKTNKMNLTFYEKLTNTSSEIGVGNLMLNHLEGNEAEILWFYLMIGLEEKSFIFYCDYVLNQQYVIYNKMKDHIIE